MEFGDTRLQPRFWSKISVVDNGCWTWIAGKTEFGYGHAGHSLSGDNLYLTPGSQRRQCRKCGIARCQKHRKGRRP